MRSQLQKLVKGFSIETTTQEAQKIKNFAKVLKIGTRVFIAHTGQTDPKDVLELCQRLRNEKMEPVPHIVARRIKSVAFLEDFLEKLKHEADVKTVLVVAGDLPKALGPFENSLQILELGILERFGIRNVYVAAHPEGRLKVSEQVLRDFLIRKNFYAKRVKADVKAITQMSFSADHLAHWEEANGRAINNLPFIAGLPGLIPRKDLIKYAIEFGLRLPDQTYRLDSLLLGLALYKKQNPKSLLGSVHFFPFGSLIQTAKWANKIADGKFRIAQKGTRIKV